MKIVDERSCPQCGELHLFTTSMPYGSRCIECNTLLETPEPVVQTTGAQWHGVEYLERGAQMVREIVAKKRQRR